MSKAMQEKDSLPDVLLSTLLAGTVIDSDKKEIGGLVDAIVRLRSGDYPILSGLVLRVGANNVFLPISDVVAINDGKVEIRKTEMELQPFNRREGEVFLNSELLAHRFIDLLHSLLVRAFDAGLTQRSEGWLVTGLDTHKRRWFQRSSTHIRHEVRDWGAFEALIGHIPSLTLRSLFGRLRTLKAAQIADLIEMASPKEREDLLSHLHENPELEADVFEELKENDQSQLLQGRSTEKIASVLAHMRTDEPERKLSSRCFDLLKVEIDHSL